MLITGPNVLLIDNKPHKILSILERHQQTVVRVRPFDSALVSEPHILPTQTWRQAASHSFTHSGKTYHLAS